jgi:hypothetical protein
MESKPELRNIVEEPDADRADWIAKSGEYCQPYFSEKRNCYIFIRRRK